MNVIISNKFKEQLDTLDIDVSKKLNGEYDVDEIINTFSGYFFNKMIIDITSLKDYNNFNQLQKLSMNLNVEKIIFLLDGQNVNPSFLSQLVSIGIYNFTTTKEGVMYLYNNPNSYKDVAHYQDPSQKLEDVAKPPEKPKEEVPRKTEEPEEKVQITLQPKPQKVLQQQIIGIKNITDNAGATTLTYILKNELSNYRDVVAIEVNKKDFIFLRDPELVSVDAKDLYNEIAKYRDKEIILIDLNSYSNYTLCTNVLYLIEPTTIKLNKMIMLDRRTFDKLQGKKIILNKSLLTKKDISSFELESASSVYFNVPPLDEKKDNKEYILPLLEKLGLIDGDSSSRTSGNDKFLGIFKI